MIMVGEVHTGLLRNSTAVTAGLSAGLLRLKPGLPAAYGERPIRYAVSPEILTGVDCDLASTHAVPRGIGTVGSRGVITGGQVLQGSSYARLVPAAASQRLSWSHYLARPGEVDVVGRMRPDHLGEGFLRAPAPPSTLDLGSINVRLVKTIQENPRLDARPAMRAQWTRVRWAASLAGEELPAVAWRLENESLRTFQVRATVIDTEELIRMLEDIALHDWLLTTVAKLIDQSRIGAAPRREIIGRLVPALDHLLHLWMPGARLGDEAKAVWQGLDRLAGLTRQWQAAIERIRDQLSLATITRLLSPHAPDHS